LVPQNATIRVCGTFKRWSLVWGTYVIVLNLSPFLFHFHSLACFVSTLGLPHTSTMKCCLTTANGINSLWTRIYKTVIYNTPFLFINLFSQVFCGSNSKLTSIQANIGGKKRANDWTVFTQKAIQLVSKHEICSTSLNLHGNAN
jgi:hypothetical protein